MKTDSNRTHYYLATALLLLGTILVQFEATAIRFIAVVAIVGAALLFFNKDMIERLLTFGEVRKDEHGSTAKSDD